MNAPIVSIMMPVYNGMPLIKASIQSLIHQSYTNWECIIVNDGSTDGTKEYIDSLEDHRFIIHHFTKNFGRPIARQKALDLAKGDFLAMLDAGDIYHPEKLEIQLYEFQKHPKVVLVSSLMCSFGINNDNLYVRGNAGLFLFNGRNLPLHGASMIRMDSAKNNHYNPRLKLGQDSDFLERLLYQKHFYVINKCLYYYSELDSVSKQKIIKAYKYRIIRYLQKKNVKLVIISILKYIFACLSFPFISIKTILAKRGKFIDSKEKDVFEKTIKPLIFSAIR